MPELNYRHLLYFWTVASEGSVLAAARKLAVSQPAISTQLRSLERSLGEPLFHRRGRRLELTEMGRVALRYADEIFELGHELTETVRGHPPNRAPRLTVGIADVVAKLIAYRLLEPALGLPEGVELICREGRTEKLLADLATHELDLVLTDAPLGPGAHVRAFSHLLGESSLSVFGSAALARKGRRRFPRSLADTPILLPAESSQLRRTIARWFVAHDIRPRIAGQFDDNALLKAFGAAGVGVFFAPTVISQEVQRQYRVRRLAEVPDLTEKYFAISIERRVHHPAVLAILRSARSGLFGG